MSLSDKFKKTINAAQAGEDYVVLIEINHPNLSEPIRVNDSGATIVSNDITYRALPFSLIWPDDVDGQSAKATVTIDNVDREIAATVKQMGSRATTIFTMVMASQPDVIEAQYTDFVLADFTGDDYTVQGILTIEDFTTQAYPALKYTPGNHPGLF